MQTNIALLERQHHQILTAIGQLRELTMRPFAEAAPHLAKARLALAKAVSENLASETTTIHEPLMAHRLTERIPAYDDIARQTRQLRVIFSNHIGHWQFDVIAADWSGYGTSLRAIVADLADILAREERELFPAAQRLLARV